MDIASDRLVGTEADLVQRDPRLVLFFTHLSEAASVVVFFVGCLVLGGWALDVAGLRTFVLPGLISMKANAALGHALIGTSLWLLQTRRAGRRARRVAQACALIVALIGSLTLVEYLLGQDLGIDQLLFREPPWDVSTGYAGRMPAYAALNFLMIGSALLLLDRRTRRGYWPAQFLALIAGVIALLILVHYGFRLSTPPGAGAFYPSMPLHGAIAFAIASAGVQFARPDRGMVQVFTSNGVGGTMARRLVPVCLIVPFALDLLTFEGERAGLYETATQTAIHSVLVTSVLLVVVYQVSTFLNRVDARRRLAEQRLKTAVDELGRSNRDLEQFASVASHDLQEPLRMVTSYVQLLGRRYAGRLDADADEFIAFAADGANRMQRLINDLLAYARLSTRGGPFATTEAEAALKQALTNLQVAIEESGAVVTHDLLPSVTGDATQLVQLLQNLVGNALKFRSDARPRIHVSARPRPGASAGQTEWVFSVRDNGIGIDPQYADNIFVMFRRLHPREAYAGTGIGLAICKRIVERHGGRIWVESETGKGATFYFTISVQGAA
jgi:signal transduction histidine kinase